MLKLENSYTVIEDGFKNNIIKNLEYKEMKKILKEIQKLNFQEVINFGIVYQPFCLKINLKL